MTTFKELCLKRNEALHVTECKYNRVLETYNDSIREARAQYDKEIVAINAQWAKDIEELPE